jgi:hypothetical protein
MMDEEVTRCCPVCDQELSEKTDSILGMDEPACDDHPVLSRLSQTETAIEAERSTGRLKGPQ